MISDWFRGGYDVLKKCVQSPLIIFFIFNNFPFRGVWKNEFLPTAVCISTFNKQLKSILGLINLKRPQILSPMPLDQIHKWNGNECKLTDRFDIIETDYRQKLI